MSGDEALPRFVDEHRITIGAPRDRVWAALRAYCARSLLKDRANPLLGVLGTEPRAGFAVAREADGERLDLAGRHRFARYRLVFELRDAGEGGTEVTARTLADFPGVTGFAYRALVIGSRAHVVAVRGMLRSIDRESSA